MDRKELAIDRRTLLEATTVVALSTAPGDAASSGAGGGGAAVETNDRESFHYGGAPIRDAAGDRGPSTDDRRTPQGGQYQGYGEYGYGGMLP